MLSSAAETRRSSVAALSVHKRFRPHDDEWLSAQCQPGRRTYFLLSVSQSIPSRRHRRTANDIAVDQSASARATGNRRTKLPINFRRLRADYRFIGARPSANTANFGLSPGFAMCRPCGSRSGVDAWSCVRSAGLFAARCFDQYGGCIIVFLRLRQRWAMYVLR